MVDVNASRVKERVVRCAEELGFDIVRFASAEPLTWDGHIAQERVRLGYMEGMPWYTEERVRQASDPRELLPGASSFIAVAICYQTAEDERIYSDELVGRVARYARWPDYHRVMKEKLRVLAREISEYAGRTVATRIFVDDSPLLERAVAQRAGIGWFGKNTNILTQHRGSWVFLGCVLTDLFLEPDESSKKSCGECAVCIPSCPTGAIVAPYTLDARLCISYLTIENRGPIPRDLRPMMRDMVFGCDICQEVCPVNVDVHADDVSGLGAPRHLAMDLIPLLSMSQEEFSSRFRDSPIKRAKRVGMQRNVCVALGNAGDQRAVPALGCALLESEEELVRGHAAWALGCLGGPEAFRLLGEALRCEQDPWVRGEIEAAVQDGLH